MALTEAQRNEVKKEFIDDSLIASWVRLNESAAADDALSAAILAADQWVEANQASYNAALPAAFRNNSSIRQKAALLFYTVRKRLQTS
jgi:hypothetical protein